MQLLRVLRKFSNHMQVKELRIVRNDSTLSTTLMDMARCPYSVRIQDTETEKQLNGFEIKMKRTRLGLTQSQAAYAFGISREHLSRIENGKRTPSKVLQRMIVALIDLDSHQKFRNNN
ncbi:MAG: hypothetical protein A2583_11430 [Bdellovibrionales bacterium RIFOXYD1_FULL_53_11]|nr:MAG: hypothetical protein A2583_11430 [Bdellovibrionales bacterium RIFOXYD1_FULL_53_11]